MALITRNTLLYGDNLPLLREYIDGGSVDLVYLDPPFNSNRSYNVLFKDESGQESEAQITAFEDTWHWNDATEHTYHELVTLGEPHVSTMIGALRQFIGSNQMMAYLVMMAARLVELHRVLRPTGSLYLHCDPTASHYLKIILDTIFGPGNFRNEVVWKRMTAHSSAKKYGPVHDIVLYYSKSSNYLWNPQFSPHSKEYVGSKYRHVDEDGRTYRLDNLTAAGVRHGSSGQPWRGIDPSARGYHWKFTIENLEALDAKGRIYWPPKGKVPQYKRYLDEVRGVALQDIWDDIGPINSQAQERLGYPTQKPLALLERIIESSSNPGDFVLDPFCGCGTAVVAAQKLNRRWIGMDITHLSIALQKYRLKAMFELEAKRDYAVIGEPEDLAAARQLAEDNHYQFQWWALSLVRARPLGGEAGSKKGKKGSDRGIDGMITFIDDSTGKPKQVLVQVKSGKVKSGDIRDLRGTLEREKAALAVFVTLETPSRAMITEAAAAGFYRSPGWNQDYPRLQILTIAELLAGSTVRMPAEHGTFKQAEKAQKQPGVQKPLL